MSEIKLNVIDADQTRHGIIHASVVDRCIAALSAEPETIAELEGALTRYQKARGDTGHFCCLSSTATRELDTKSWDAGIAVIDLSARIVALESTYSAPGPEGEVCYHDGNSATDVPIMYRLADDWLFVNSVEAYEWSRERRVQQRAAQSRFDARLILFGSPLIQFLVNACISTPLENSPSKNNGDTQAADRFASEISTIHARWLLTPREDLQGQSPREVLLAKQELIDWDLQTRSLQWSMLNEGPPCLPRDSFAYRFAGFGTHEWVIYYKLVRYLLQVLVDRLSNTVKRPGAEELISSLEQLKEEWLNNPQPDLDGRIPAIVMDNERKRLPEAMRPRDMIIDEDCPMCMMFGDEHTPLGMGVGFWHLDGSSMDDDFAFSPFKTREEWEADNRRFEEMQLDLARRDYERRQIDRAETLEFARFVDTDEFDE